jgi:hypothetical protein
VYCGECDGTLKSLDVPRSDSREIGIDVIKGQFVCYEFTTEFYDIAFGISFEVENIRRAIREIEKVNSYQTKEEGRFTAEDSGRVLLHFDNTYSWTRGKTVNYRIWIEDPATEPPPELLPEMTPDRPTKSPSRFIGYVFCEVG